ncbi:class I SAM-dependent methyltransferase [uncultured Roseovarius sp.]|uniref:class I SAM-dependent methyltransferase n=1 Tax=uncultured Roseovarius sp. TaxID=293344 RepID=UPI00260987B7|nr:class I SAM-dependent methyltransferase [uncultured Roseovarius sp.]
MSFAADWLDLREPADARARDPGILAHAVQHAGQGRVLLDLGCGTGATARVFAGAGATGLDWRLFDNDRDLLAVAAQRHPQAEICHGDLADISAIPLAGVRMVTASALLDLVSYTWVEQFVARLAHEGTGLYAALSYDGAMRWAPSDEADIPVTERFNAHQRSDKGLGPALGPDAAASTVDLLRAEGYEVILAQSPWRLGPGEAALHDRLLSGIAKAACETGLSEAQAWAERRKAKLGHSRAEIGHIDLFAQPPGWAVGG